MRAPSPAPRDDRERDDDGLAGAARAEQGGDGDDHDERAGDGHEERVAAADAARQRDPRAGGAPAGAGEPHRQHPGDHELAADEVAGERREHDPRDEHRGQAGEGGDDEPLRVPGRHATRNVSMASASRSRAKSASGARTNTSKRTPRSLCTNRSIVRTVVPSGCT